MLEKCQGNSHSLALDLHDQWTYMQKTTQWRFTPPTHVVAAFRAALDQFQAEGGVAARGARYRRNCETLVEGMARAGLRARSCRARCRRRSSSPSTRPADPAYTFKPFYEKVKARGYVLYPGKLTQVETFRVGCIGAIDDNEMRNVVSARGRDAEGDGRERRWRRRSPPPTPEAGAVSAPCRSRRG